MYYKVCEATIWLGKISCKDTISSFVAELTVAFFIRMYAFMPKCYMPKINFLKLSVAASQYGRILYFCSLKIFEYEEICIIYINPFAFSGLRLFADEKNHG